MISFNKQNSQNEKLNKKNLRLKSFAIYGLGITGLSVIKYFKKNKFNNYYTWDDKKNSGDTLKLKKKKFFPKIRFC